MPDTAAVAMDYVESLPYIERIANKFTYKFGGDVEELLSLSNEIFCDIHAELPENRSWFPWLHGCLWNRWLDFTRWRLAKCRATCGDAGLETVQAPTAAAPFSVALLSDDAWLVASVALSPPEALVKAAEGRGGTPTNYRSCIRQHFMQMGWDRVRIQAAFDEIGDSFVR